MRSPKRRSVGGGSGKQSSRLEGAVAEKRHRKSRQASTSNDDRRGANIQSQALSLQGCEETRPDLQADCEDEEDQPKLTRKVEHLVLDVPSKMTESSPAKSTPALPNPIPRILIAAMAKPTIETTHLSRPECLRSRSPPPMRKQSDWSRSRKNYHLLLSET